MKRIVAFLMALVIFCAGTCMAEGSELEVNGGGSVLAQADQASIYLGISITDEDVAELQKRANETINSICAALEDAGVSKENITTNYLYISPRYDYSGETEKLIGYSISNSLCVVTDEIDQVGAYIDAAFAAGANTFDSINFSLKDDFAAHKQALEIAVKNAREKAEIIATASGKTLGETLEIKEDNDYNYMYESAGSAVRYSVSGAVAMDAAGTTVRASEIQVTAGVSITYELK